MLRFPRHLLLCRTQDLCFRHFVIRPPLNWLGFSLAPPSYIPNTTEMPIFTPQFPCASPTTGLSSSRGGAALPGYGSSVPPPPPRECYRTPQPCSPRRLWPDSAESLCSPISPCICRISSSTRLSSLRTETDLFLNSQRLATVLVHSR